MFLKLLQSIVELYISCTFFSDFILRKIYMVLFYPHLTYAVTVWGGGCSKGSLGRLQSLQNKCVKYLYKNKPFQNIDLYDRNKLFNISQIYFYFTAVQFYKYNFCNHIEYFHNRIENDQIFHSHLTRFKNNNNLILPFPRIVKYKHSFYYNSIKIWNCLPEEIRNSNTVHKFKKSVRFYIFNTDLPLVT